MRERSPEELLRFESAYERIGLPALLIQVATGLWLSYRLLPEVGRWFQFADPISRVIGLKLVLLALTAGFALDARLRLIPRLSAGNLSALAWHIVPVTVLSVLFVVLGVSFRTCWFY